MCLLPPNCLFCIHYHLHASQDEADCDAFREIPEAIFSGGNPHFKPFHNDHGIRFELDPAMREEYEEVLDLRRQLLLTRRKYG